MTTPDQPTQPCHLAGMHPADCPAYVAGIASLRERVASAIVAPRDRGICGAFAPTLADGPTPICTLMAEHPGWHGDREGMSWVERNDAGPLAAAYERGIFDAGVAEGRRQATEGRELAWGVRMEWVQGPMTLDCVDRATAEDYIAALPPSQRGIASIVSRLVGPWEAAEQAEPTCTCPLIDVTNIREYGEGIRTYQQGWDPNCPACRQRRAEQDGDGRG